MKQILRSLIIVGKKRNDPNTKGTRVLSMPKQWLELKEIKAGQPCRKVSIKEVDGGLLVTPYFENVNEETEPENGI